MEKVFYTITVSDTLIFSSPSHKSVFHLRKISEYPIPKTLAGIWSVAEAQQESTDILLKANGTTLQICNGKAIIGYTLIGTSIKFEFQKVKGCSENGLLTALYSA